VAVGRATVATSAALPPLAVALASLAFPAALLAVLLREILAGQNWRNVKVAIGVAALTTAQGLFTTRPGASGAPLRRHLAIAALALIMIVGGGSCRASRPTG
jgi:uncharacterized protein involved in response to NO